MRRRRATQPHPLLLGVALAPALLLALLQGCPRGSDTACAPACTTDQYCDTTQNRCRATPRARFGGETVPGRGVRIVMRERTPFIATIDPITRALIVGDPRGDQPTLHILASGDAAPTYAVQVATHQATLYVAWPDQEGRYRVASRAWSGAPDQWEIETIAPVSGAYRASDDFAVAIDEEGAVVLAMRDADAGHLRALVRDDETGLWRVEEVDRGQGEARKECPTTIRTLRGRGLGYQPDALTTPRGDLYISYHDGDCGTLRLARRREGAWTVAVLDHGSERTPQTPDTERVTGQHSSLATDASGGLAVAYHNATRGQLLFGRLVDDQLEREVVDPGLVLGRFAQTTKQLVGMFATLTFDRSDRPVITYMNATDTELLRATRTEGQQWQVTTLATEGLVGFFADHARDAVNDRAIIVSEQITPGASGSGLLFIEEVSQ